MKMWPILGGGVLLAIVLGSRKSSASSGGSSGESEPLGEDRVRVSDYGSIKSGDPRLVRIGAPFEYGGARYVHKAILVDTLGLLQAAKAAGFDLKVSSAWRLKPWKTLADYEAWCVRPKSQDGGGYGSVAECRKWRAFNSPHETGLTIDLRGSGLAASSAVAEKMKTTAAYKWLVANAHKFGFTPYSPEPWHWEHKIPKEQW